MAVVNQIYSKYFNPNSIRHAYLLETKNFQKILDIIYKILLSSNTEVDNLKEIIGAGNYPDLKIIEPDGQWIKKEQIINLKDEFKSKSSFNNKRIYVIKNAEHLNKSSANTILKFLEEPEENIIAIMVTENKSKVLETIVSRCQYIMLDSNAEQFNDYGEAAKDIFEILEKEKQSSGFKIIKKIENYDDRKEIKNILLDLINIYEYVLLKKIGVNITIKNNEEIDKIIEKSTIYEIQKRINGLISITNSLDYNVNLKLLVDKLVIMMFGVD